MSPVVIGMTEDVILARLSLGPIEVPMGPYLEEDLRRHLDLVGHQGDLAPALEHLINAELVSITPTGRIVYEEAIVDPFPPTGPVLEVREVRRTIRTREVVRISAL